MRKRRQGVVRSDKMNKTRVVEASWHVRHPLYEKVRRRRSRFYMHDEKNETHVGDKVLMEETPPLSHLKRWRLVQIVGKTK